MGFQMEDRDIEQLLQVQRVDAGRRGWRCPDETQLAAYVTQGLAGSRRSSVEGHLADCDFCLSQELSSLIRGLGESGGCTSPAASASTRSGSAQVGQNY